MDQLLQNFVNKVKTFRLKKIIKMFIYIFIY